MQLIRMQLASPESSVHSARKAIQLHLEGLVTPLRALAFTLLGFTGLLAALEGTKVLGFSEC